MLPKMNIVHCP